MAVTVSGTSITFNDGTTQTTAAGVPTTTQVLNATAGASVGAVGSYAFLRRINNVGDTRGNILNPGATIAGSLMRYADTSSLSGTPSGTWRCMGYASAYYSGYDNVTSYGSTVFLRIS